jgi:hypothetical protein
LISSQELPLHPHPGEQSRIGLRNSGHYPNGYAGNAAQDEQVGKHIDDIDRLELARDTRMARRSWVKFVDRADSLGHGLALAGQHINLGNFTTISSGL